MVDQPVHNPASKSFGRSVCVSVNRSVSKTVVVLSVSKRTTFIPLAFTGASLLAFTVETRRISQQKTTQPKDTQRPQTSRQKVEPKRPPAKTSTAPKPPAGKQVYISPNRLQPVGPQASLRKGPDRSQLV